MRLLGYAWRSTDEQPTTLDVQVEAVTAWAAAGGHTLVVTTTDRCARTQAVHRLDYYGDGEGWALLILDALDRRQSPEAQLLHGIRVSVAAYERALIARRTRAALAYRKAIGVRIGRPRRCPDDVLTRVLELRAGGARLVDVAAAMNDAGVPTPGGGARWWPSHVSRLLATQDARTAAAAPGTASAPVPARSADIVDQNVDQAVDYVVDQAATVVPPPGDAELVVQAADQGRVVDLDARIGWVRQSATTRGRRGWQARLADGTEVPAGGRLAVAAGSTLWRSRDLAAAAIAHHRAR